MFINHNMSSSVNADTSDRRLAAERVRLQRYKQELLERLQEVNEYDDTKGHELKQKIAELKAELVQLQQTKVQLLDTLREVAREENRNLWQQTLNDTLRWDTFYLRYKKQQFTDHENTLYSEEYRAFRYLKSDELKTLLQFALDNKMYSDMLLTPDSDVSLLLINWRKQVAEVGYGKKTEFYTTKWAALEESMKISFGNFHPYGFLPKKTGPVFGLCCVDYLEGDDMLMYRIDIYRSGILPAQMGTPSWDRQQMDEYDKFQQK